ncbi:MAG TPA: hypothetical protein VLK33_18625 [Terriglobales bacterium]|nr:hypothetical protein [Terriglobales bacterium]
MVVENVPAQDDDVTFRHPGICAERRNVRDWVFAPATDQLMFAVMSPVAKAAVFEFFRQCAGVQETHFTSLISPRAFLASNVEVSKACYVEPAVVLSPYSCLKFGATINRSASIGHHTEVEPYAMVGPGAHIGGHSHIGREAVIGIGATVLDHIRIGNGSIIGGGSVVTKDVPPGVVAYGNPCRVVRDV